MPFSILANRPATHDRAVAFCCDDGYLPYALFAAARIADLHPMRDFDILLCASGPVEVPAALDWIDLRVVEFDMAGAFDGLRLDAGRTDVVYLRLMLPPALADDYSRILYLDSDIHVQGGDLSALMDVGLGGRILGAVRDNTQWRTPLRRPEQFRRLGLPTAPYFNAGVMLIDVPAYVEERLMDRCVDLGRRESAQMIRHDQNLYNAVLQGDWAELSPVWNWQYTSKSRLHEAMADPHIVHFIGGAKPWNDPSGRLAPRFGRELRAFLDLYMPDRMPPPQGTPPGRQLGRMRTALSREWLAAGRMNTYLRRFAGDLVVKT